MCKLIRVSSLVFLLFYIFDLSGQNLIREISQLAMTTADQTSFQEKQYRFLALGDSYTIGEGVSASGRWPVQLCEKLKQAGYPMKSPDIIATTGWTTGELLSGIAQRKPGQQYSLVSLLIGVNNQYRGLEIYTFEEEFKKLLDEYDSIKKLEKED